MRHGTSFGLLLVLSALIVASPALAATIEVSGATHMTANAEYDRNPSIVYDGSDYWLFWTKGDDISTAGVRGGAYNPDADTYVVYYKTAGTLAGLASAAETKLALSETSRPANFDQRVVSATYFGGDIYAFASSGQSGTDRGLYCYKWNGVSWTGPTTLIADATARGGHVNVTSDANYVYIVWEATADASSDCYTWDGTTLNAKIDISTDNQPKIALDGTTLYVVSIEDGTGDIEAYSATAGGAPVFSSHSTPVPGAGFYDPCIVSDGTDLRVVTAPWLSGTDQQYLIETVYSGGSWSASNTVTMGGYGTTYWWDYWPVAYYDGSDVYIFFTTETASPSYSDGEIAMLKMDWDLGNEHYLYVQNAIDAASASDLIDIAAGTYREQLKIDGKSLDLVGAGIGSTIVEAVDVSSRTTYSITKWTSTIEVIDPCIGIVGPGTVNISGLTVDGRDLGPDHFYGIYFFDASGSVTYCRIEDIEYPAVPGAQKVVSLVATQSDAVASYAIDFSDNVIPNLQKGGILIMGPDFTFTVDDNEVTDVTSDNIAGNGIQLSYGATGTTSGNVVQGVEYSGADWAGTGILLFESGSVSMDGDEVYNCESAVAFSDWGWIHVHPSQVLLDFVGLDLHDNAWTLGVKLSRDGSDVDVDITDCLVTNSTGDGIDLWGSDAYAGYYTGWDNGSLAARISGCTITNTTIDGIWIDDVSGNATNSIDVSVHQTGFSGNSGSALWNGDSDEVDAEYCWWGDPAGPTLITEPPRANQPAAPRVSPYGADLPEQGEVRYAERSSSRAGDGVSTNVDYTPWLTGNIVCDPDPEYLTAAASTKTIAVKYLGGGSGAMFGYSVKFSWDSSVVGTTIGDVNEGNLLSDLGGTFFYVADGTGDEIIVDCALLGSITGATGPGTLFTVDFTGLAVGTSDIDVTIINVRDQYNNPLSGFYEDDGLLIVDVSVPTIANVEIFNTTLAHTDDYIKDTDGAQVTATVLDDDPAFGASDIVANLTGLGGGAAVNPDSHVWTTGLATWTIVAPPGVTCTPANGTVWVYVDAADAIGNPAAQGSDDIIADNLAPTAVTDFDAAPGNQKCDLSWTMGTDLYPAGVVVQRDDNTGDYPLYAVFKGAWPNVDAFYPGNESLGTNVYNGTGTSTADAVMDRNIYYYQAFCYDEARNYGLVASTARDLATNYWLGDVAAAIGVWGYNGFVNDADIDKLGSKYHEAPGGSPEDEMDVGPTVHPAYGRLGLPTPDDFVGFEDLMIFAMNYGVVSARVVPLLSEPVEGQLALSLEEISSDAAGTVELALRLEGNTGEVKGVSAVLELEGMELVSVRLSDEMSTAIAQTFLWYGADQIDIAILGTDVTIGGSGEVARLTFQTTSEQYGVGFASAVLRGIENEDLDASLEGYEASGSIPTVFRLVQNSPNPFNPVTKVAYHVPSESRVTIRVFDVTGRLVTTLVDDVVEPGRHAAVWNGTNDAGESVGSGVYFCTMETPDYRGSHKMMLLK